MKRKKSFQNKGWVKWFESCCWDLTSTTQLDEVLDIALSEGYVGGGNGECGALLLSIINQCADPHPLPPTTPSTLSLNTCQASNADSTHHTPLGSDEQKPSTLTWSCWYGQEAGEEERGRRPLAVIVHLWDWSVGLMRQMLLLPLLRRWSCQRSDGLSLMCAYGMQVWWRPNVWSTHGASEYRLAHHIGVASTGEWRKQGNRKEEKNRHMASLQK